MMDFLKDMVPSLGAAFLAGVATALMGDKVDVLILYTGILIYLKLEVKS